MVQAVGDIDGQIGHFHRYENASTTESNSPIVKSLPDHHIAQLQYKDKKQRIKLLKF